MGIDQSKLERYPNEGTVPYLKRVFGGGASDLSSVDHYIEGNQVTEEYRERAVQTLLATIPGEYTGREGLLETPARFSKALAEYTAGYDGDPNALLKSFNETGYDQLVIVRDIPFYSLCEHHLAPFFGTATVAYLPSGRVVGLSKLARLVEMFARRLQVQERLTREVATALFKAEPLNCKGAAVIVRARHLCMESRGIQRPGATTVTSEMLGAFRDETSLRQEFLSLAEVTR